MRHYSMKSLKRRKHQRWVNYFIKQVNRIMEQDEKLCGRFYVTQDRTRMRWFEDKSGGLIKVQLTMHDLKSGNIHTKAYTALELEWKFWLDYNVFICDSLHPTSNFFDKTQNYAIIDL